MNFLLIPDKFKGSISADGVIRALEDGIKSALPGAACFSVLASDGGDGFLDAVAKYRPTQRVLHTTVDPLGREIRAGYLYNSQEREAYVELAEASGLVLLQMEERTALDTSTLGTGLQIKHAIEKGARTIYIGLGGSATNDGGTGIAHALGYRFLDRSGNELEPVGGNLENINSIDSRGVSDLVKSVAFYAINDVNNPLYGPDGAAHVYAAQKGADQQAIANLDRGLRNLDTQVSGHFDKKYAAIPGAGAAGGTSYGLKAFFEATFISGIEFMLKIAGVPRIMEENKIDFIITGEGKIDMQTLSGKLINGVLNLGKSKQIPVIAVCGMLEVPKSRLQAEGLSDVVEIRNREQSLEYNMAHAPELLREAAESYFSQI